jgi:hypothetical protein
MLRVQEFLLTNSLADLYATHAVKARADTRNGHKVSLNYDQIEARDADLVAQECRGLILTTMDGRPFPMTGVVGQTRVIARSFDRFFNHGTACAADVPLEHAKTRIYEKLDGTLCILYFDPFCDQWHVATRAVAEADLPMDGWSGHTFRTLFEKALEVTFAAEHEDADGFTFFNRWTRSKLNREVTYLLELTTPLNQVVVAYPDFRITLLGMRDTATGGEFWPEDGHRLGTEGIPVCPSHSLATHEDVLELVRSRDPKAYEGVVGVHEAAPGIFHRVKIKNAQYLAYSRLKDSIASPRNVMMLILGENLDDALGVMPEDIKKHAFRMQDGMRALLHGFDVAYVKLHISVSKGTTHEHGSKEHRKAFAICAKNSGLWFEPAMAVYAGKAKDARDFIVQKREDNGDWSASFLDYLIEKALEAAPKDPA